MTLTYKVGRGRYPKLLTPCPFSFGWKKHGEWGLGAKKAVMVGSSICEMDCPYNGGVKKDKKQCICNKQHDGQ